MLDALSTALTTCSISSSVPLNRAARRRSARPYKGREKRNVA